MNKIKKALDVLSGDCQNPIIKDDMIKVLREQFTNLENSFDASCNHNAELKSDNDTLRTEKAALSEALGELVFLKKMKDTNGKTPTYLQQQPKAWEAAMQILDTLEL